MGFLFQPRRRRVVDVVVRFLVLVLSGHLTNVAALVLIPGDRAILGIEAFDARWLFGATTVVGVFYALAPRLDALRDAWAVLFTCSTWGRCLSLVFLGSPQLNRGQELAGASAWLCFFVAGVVAILVLNATTALDHVDRHG